MQKGAESIPLDLCSGSDIFDALMQREIWEDIPYTRSYEVHVEAGIRVLSEHPYCHVGSYIGDIILK